MSGVVERLDLPRGSSSSSLSFNKPSYAESTQDDTAAESVPYRELIMAVVSVQVPVR